MTYIYGYSRNRYLIFGILFIVFLSSLYISIFPRTTAAGFLFIISGVGGLMVLVKEMRRRVVE